MQAEPSRSAESVIVETDATDRRMPSVPAAGLQSTYGRVRQLWTTRMCA